ncbi:glycine-rich RNA-binding protein 4, mitochondrial [Dioscorea cayenensis subsp. rotundata]|uniref:Glycine-rich RNA-binding protein 4, mitochondrial n=1 Tax=Dioscorea cayennensis subsp. rotundata TaxID=55577 RepID=A0AB40AZ98_DIOCR|nr:glycine-rich RNA-binding protein 4, mitochondrial [Dioscorea cayenensis subsp. rotundata]
MAMLCSFGRIFLVRPAAAIPLRFYCASSPSNSKLFVGGLSWTVDEKSLHDAFSSFGEVTEVRIMYDKGSGRSRGFGFVYFATAYEAKCAKEAMDGKAFLGRPLRISFALEKVRGAPVVVPRLLNSEESRN